jgi:hypothetical protein
VLPGRFCHLHFDDLTEKITAKTGTKPHGSGHGKTARSEAWVIQLFLEKPGYREAGAPKHDAWVTLF